MDIIRLYQDFSVNYLTEGHKHCRPGWVNTPCPFCTGNPGYHLGYNLQGDFYTCWRCGWHPISLGIANLINISEQEARRIISQYGLLIPKLTREPLAEVKAKAFKLPSNTMPLQSNHKRYLEGRGFDPAYLEREWNLVGTGPISLLDNINYKHRIIIPFIWNYQQVSFDSRDITGKDGVRYKACPKDRELIEHKSILYGRQEKWKETGILVEGPTDVWRMGTSSCAVSGIKYTNQQLRVLSKSFRRVAVCFDDDPQAIIQSNKIVAELKFRGVDAFRVDIEGDPGGMKQEDADYLVKQLIR
jgi:hypothetical protein